MCNQDLHCHLQMQLGSQVACSPESSDSHADKMMMVFPMYGLRANQSAKAPESLRRTLSGDLVSISLLYKRMKSRTNTKRMNEQCKCCFDKL